MEYRFDKLTNFRDAGGLKTADGRTMKKGVLFRSAEPRHATERDWAALRELGIQRICDLRAADESRKRQPRQAPNPGIEAVNIPVRGIGSVATALGFLFRRDGADRFRQFGFEYYRHIAFEEAPRFGEAVSLLAREDGLPALVHCRAGKDRTGFLVSLVHASVGVPYEAAVEDFLRTNESSRKEVDRLVSITRAMTLFQVPEERIRYAAIAHREFLDDVHASIRSRHGSVEGYLREACGVSAESLRALKQRLID